jgi:hypothetical protein
MHLEKFVIGKCARDGLKTKSNIFNTSENALKNFFPPFEVGRT